MLKHIVVWKFKDEAEGKSRAENCALVRQRLLSLVGVIPEVKRMEIGIDIGSIQGNFDLALIVETDNTATLSARSEERRVGKECRSRWSPYH